MGMAQRADIRGAIDILMQDNTTMAGVLTELAGASNRFGAPLMMWPPPAHSRPNRPPLQVWRP